jgi:transcriptional regulator with XRE-family HTH domain
MTATTTLGDYLSARRALVRPGDVGLPAGGRRRVDGLRREEVAMLAGISADYYLRLEQGRDHSPSAQVLESLARVLLLDDTATAYLLAFVAPRPRRRTRGRRASVPDGIRDLVASIGLPAHVESRQLDVLAANDLARAVNPNLQVGGNRLRSMFLDPAEQALCPGFEDAMAFMVASFRQSIGPDGLDPRSVRLVGELSIASDDFRRLWARHDVHVREGGVAVMPHPRVGDLTLSKERLAVAGDDGLTLVVYHPAPGTGTAERLQLLASLAVSA